MKLQPGQRNDPSLRTESTVAAALFGLSLLPAVPVAADIDEQIAQRVAAIEETLERLEFDAGRIDEPPAYQQALKAFSGSICAALTASTDVDANLFSLSAAFEGEAEAEVLMPGADAVVATAFNEFEAEGGESVRAVAPGAVRFAGWFRGYGRLVIVDHGDDYFTVVSHLEDTFVAVGDVVAEGDTLGSVGETGSLTGPSLYFEIRRGSEPLDPADWLAPRPSIAAGVPDASPEAR